MADNECIGSSFGVGKVSRYTYRGMCGDDGKRHSLHIKVYRYRILYGELHRLLCAYLDQRAFQLDIIRYNQAKNQIEGRL